MAPAAYLQRYHGPVTEASAPAQMVSSVREAVQSVSASPSLHKAAENRPKLQPTWHSQRHHSIDKERKPYHYQFLLIHLHVSVHSCHGTYGKSFLHVSSVLQPFTHLLQDDIPSRLVYHNPNVVLFLPLPSPFSPLPFPPPPLLSPSPPPPLTLPSPSLISSHLQLVSDEYVAHV